MISVYFGRGKKGARVAAAFAEGCGGVIVGAPPRLLDGACAFYGVKPETLHLWRQARAEGREFFYIANGYLVRGPYPAFRVTRDAEQHGGLGEAPPDRWRDLGIEIAPWHYRGRAVLGATQTPWWYVRHGLTLDRWLAGVIAILATATDRPVVIRHKRPPDTDGLAPALADAWAVVTYTSAVAIEAILAGVPAFVTGASAAAPMASTDVAGIEDPYYPDDRERWCRVLAANQWTLDEMRDGTCWRDLNA